MIEIKYDKILSGLGITAEQFIDLCILLGCDYAGKIKGIGPKKALTLIRDCKTIEKSIEAIKT